MNDEVEKMKIISVKENPEFMNQAIKYFQSKWANEKSMMLYEDSITHCTDLSNSLPQWYLLKKGEKVIGCSGLITNDFISRMDLYPWICALYIEEEYRGNDYGAILLEKAKKAAKNGGFNNLYLATHHIGYYEKYGFEYLGVGYHPWGETSRIYKITIS